jgi:hypothetical protein
MKLPVEERRRILAAAAERLRPHYVQDHGWKDLQDGDIIEE